MKKIALMTFMCCGLLAIPVHAASLRLFFSETGLSNPADPNSPISGSPALKVPVVPPGGGSTPKRLYLWAQPLGTPAIQVWNGISLVVYLTEGGVISAWNIFNYDNGAGFRRWTAVQQGVHGIPESILFINMVKVVTDQGVSSNGSPADLHYDPVTKSTLLGWFEFKNECAVYLVVGDKGITRRGSSGPPGEGINLGFGDEANGVQGGDFLTGSSSPEALMTAPLEATNSLWVSPADGSYEGTANWSPTGVPGAATAVHFLDVPSTVTLNADANNAALYHHGHPFLLTLNLNGHTWTNGRVVVGDSVSYYDEQHVQLAGGILRCNSWLELGGPGERGELTVSAGATLHMPATLNLVIVGAFDGIGYLNAVDGGHIVIDSLPNSGIEIGVGYDSHGELSISGAGSTLASVLPLNIADGESAFGVVYIQNGGVAQVPYCSLGLDPDFSNGLIFVDGAGSALTCTNGMTIGVEGVGLLTVRNGGSVTCGPTGVGFGTSRSYVTIEDTNSTLHFTGDFYMSGYDATIGTDSTLEVADGGSLITDQKFGLFPRAHLDLNGGTIIMNSDGGSAGTIHAIRGQMTSTGAIDDFELFPPGVFYPGDLGSRLEITVAGPTPVVDYPFFAIGGDFTAAGSLTVLLANGYTLSAGQDLVLIAASSISGTFTTTSLPPGTSLRYDSGAIVLEGPGCPAVDVPTFTVSTFASVIDPIQLSFTTAGVLYAGRDNGGSGGGNADPVKIHRIAAGGSPVTQYGATILNDPDSVVVDALGLFSTAGSVLVGGQSTVANQGYIAAISPVDQSITMLLGGPTLIYADPQDMVFDHTNRLLIADRNNKQVLAWTPGQPAPVVLISLGGPQSRRIRNIAIDALNRIYTSTEEGIIRRHNADGTSGIILATGLSIPTPLAIGPGGMWGTKLYTVSGGKLKRYDANTPGPAENIGCGFNNQSADLTFGPDGVLYVSRLNDDKIIRIGRLSGDVTGNGTVNVDDLLVIINGWGRCPPAPADCPADVAPPPHGNGIVNVDDLLAVINGWG